MSSESPLPTTNGQWLERGSENCLPLATHLFHIIAMCPTSNAYPRAKKKSSNPYTRSGLETCGNSHDTQAFTPNRNIRTKETKPVNTQHPMKMLAPARRSANGLLWNW